MANPFEAYEDTLAALSPVNAGRDPDFNLVGIARGAEAAAEAGAVYSAVAFPLVGAGAAIATNLAEPALAGGAAFVGEGLMIGGALALPPLAIAGNIAGEAYLMSEHPDVAASVAVSLASGPGGM